MGTKKKLKKTFYNFVYIADIKKSRLEATIKKIMSYHKSQENIKKDTETTIDIIESRGHIYIEGIWEINLDCLLSDP